MLGFLKYTFWIDTTDRHMIDYIPLIVMGRILLLPLWIYWYRKERKVEKVN